MTDSNFKEMERMGESIEKFAVAGARRMSTVMHHAFTKGDPKLAYPFAGDTPVDTGRAKSGWRVKLNQPSTYLPPKLKKSRAIVRHTARAKHVIGYESGPDLSRVQSRSAVTQITAKMKLGDTIIHTDLVPYIGVLESGRKGPGVGSKQAPQGMTKFARQAVEDSLKRWKYRGGRGGNL